MTTPLARRSAARLLAAFAVAAFGGLAAAQTVEVGGIRWPTSAPLAGSTLALNGAEKKLAVGESIGIDWLPGQGTQIMINGKPCGEPVKEPEFFNPMLRIWLGKAPVDESLKEALLGREVKAVTNPGQQ